MNAFSESLGDLSTMRTNRIDYHEPTKSLTLRNNIDWLGHPPLGDIDWKLEVLET